VPAAEAAASAVPSAVVKAEVLHVGRRTEQTPALHRLSPARALVFEPPELPLPLLVPQTGAVAAEQPAPARTAVDADIKVVVPPPVVSPTATAAVLPSHLTGHLSSQPATPLYAGRVYRPPPQHLTPAVGGLMQRLTEARRMIDAVQPTTRVTELATLLRLPVPALQLIHEAVVQHPASVGSPLPPLPLGFVGLMLARYLYLRPLLSAVGAASAPARGSPAGGAYDALLAMYRGAKATLARMGRLPPLATLEAPADSAT
jgi:hypothetical protein